MDTKYTYTILAYNGERTLLYGAVSKSEFCIVEDDVRRAGAVITNIFPSTDRTGRSYEMLRRAIIPSRRFK